MKPEAARGACAGVTPASRGFSLIELMLCVGLLALVLIFVIALFTKMLNAATKGGDLSVATYVGSAELDKLTYDPQYLNNVLLGGGIFNTQVAFGGGTESLNRTVFSIKDDVSSLGNSGQAATNLYYVDVEVDWLGHENEVGGVTKQSLHLDRLIYATPYNP